VFDELFPNRHVMASDIFQASAFSDTPMLGFFVKPLGSPNTLQSIGQQRASSWIEIKLKNKCVIGTVCAPTHRSFAFLGLACRS
jgi:hypothetical protein